MKPLDLDNVFDQLKNLNDLDMLITKKIFKFISKYNANDSIEIIQLILQDLEKIFKNCQPDLVTNVFFLIKNIPLETFEQTIKDIQLVLDFLIELNEDELKLNEINFKDCFSEF